MVLLLVGSDRVGSRRACGAETPSPAETPFRAAVKAVQAAAHAQGDSGPAYLAELERGFLRLQQEYPGENEVYVELLYVADHTPGGKGDALVRRIEEWPASASTKDKARGVLAKRQALGRPYARTLASVQGPEIDLSHYRGKVVLLDFWATWCPPCRKGLPELKETFARLQPKGLEIVGISFDTDLVKLRQFLTREGMGWPQHCPGTGWESGLADRFGITSLPTMWLIDRKGRLRETDARTGYAARIEALLAE